MTTQERAYMLDEAEQLVAEAFDKVREAIKGTAEEPNADAYLLESFKDILGTGNPYNLSIGKVREAIVDGPCMGSFDENGDCI
jgi:vacuolar-type H+-ATPase subunit E/Vma4